MLSYIGFLPAFIAYRYALVHSAKAAFLQVYLPVLLCFPNYYRVITPGLPDPTFAQGVSIAIFISAMSQGGFIGCRFSHLDIVVVIYAFCVFNSELQASGYSDAQNLLFEMLFSVLVPYYMAKTFIEPGNLRFEFAKKIVWCLALVSMLNLYETRMGSNLWQLTLGRFFPGQGEGWLTTFRFGFARTAGPYAHALLAGIMMLVGFRLQRWLQFSAAWPDKIPIPQLSWIPIRFPHLMTLILTGGFFLTFAKGAWLAGFLAGFLVAVGRMKNRVLALMTVLGFVLFVLVPSAMAFISYASVGRENAKDDNQETAAYRYELVIKYLDIAKAKAWEGWGLTKWPKVPGMPSIDNHYLLVMLMHGQITLICLVYLLLGTMLRLLIHSLKHPPPARSGASLSFTLASVFLGYTVAIGTVYMGEQTIPLLFMLLGWAESYMVSGGVDRSADGEDSDQVPSASSAPFRFRRVLYRAAVALRDVWSAMVRAQNGKVCRHEWVWLPATNASPGAVRRAGKQNSAMSLTDSPPDHVHLGQLAFRIQSP